MELSLFRNLSVQAGSFLKLCLAALCKQIGYTSYLLLGSGYRIKAERAKNKALPIERSYFVEYSFFFSELGLL